MFGFLEDIACAILSPLPDLIDAAFDTACSGVDALDRGVKYAKENPVEAAAVAAAAAVASTVGAGAIASAIGKTGMLGRTVGGTTIKTLSGAALEKASLAKLAGGAKAVGGFGVVGGKVVVGASSGAVAGSITRLATGRSESDIGQSATYHPDSWVEVQPIREKRPIRLACRMSAGLASQSWTPGKTRVIQVRRKVHSPESDY